MDGFEVAADCVPVPGQALDAGVHLLVAALQGSDEFRRGVDEVDRAGIVQAGEYFPDDGGRDPGVEQPADLRRPLDVARVVVAVAVSGAVRVKQPRLS
jgi:hypothetical protein